MTRTPLTLRANIVHNHVVHDRVVIVPAKPVNSPRVRRRERITIDDVGYAFGIPDQRTVTMGPQVPL